MTTLEQAARQALETLERASDAGYSVECDETITALREALEQVAPKAAPGEPSNWPEICDGKEQEMWEAWALRNKYDMRQHPLHYLFLHPETNAARQGWKAGLQYAVDQMRKAAPQQGAQADNQPVPVVDKCTKQQMTTEVLRRMQQQEDGHNKNPFRSLLDRLMRNEGGYSTIEIGQLKYALDGFYGAARAPADSVTAPAATVIMKGADRQWMSERLGHLPDGIYSLYLAPQPAPAPMSRDQIREVFMAHGFTVKEGQTDLKQYVYDAAYALLELVEAPPAEQQGITPETGNSVPAQGAAITSESGAVYAELPEPTASIGIDDAWHEPAMRDFADRTHALRMQAAPKAAQYEMDKEASNVRLDIDSNSTKPEQQRDMACSLEVGQHMGNGKHQEASCRGSKDSELLKIAARNLKYFIDHAQFSSFADKRAALNCLDALAAPTAEQAAPKAAPGERRNTKTHDLLSTMIGLFLGHKRAIGYKPGSVIDKVVNEAVEHLKDWPYPEAAPTWPSEARVWEALQAYLKHDTNMEGMRAALIVGAEPRQEAQEPVSPRHPVVIQWRDNAIEACAKIADAYGHEQAAQDMRAMLTVSRQEAQEPVVAAVFDEQLGRPVIVEGAPLLSHGQPLYTAPQPAPLINDVFQKTWALLDELEKLRGVDSGDEDWVTLNTRDEELRAALRTSRWWELCAK